MLHHFFNTQNISFLQDQMQSVSDTKWDLVIAGTGLPQSLLALYVSYRGYVETKRQS